jgi:two-component system, OmpR family, phosphate regulon sensor histidine kinase PhoR
MSKSVESPASLPQQELSEFREESISHLIQELRNPLSNIKTALKLLDSPLLKVAQRQRYIDMIKGECDRQHILMARTIDLLSLDRGSIDLPPANSVKIAEIVPNIIGMYRSLANDRQIELNYKIAPHLPSPACQETCFKQILINLIDNGIKYTPSGGRVSIEIWDGDRDLHLEVRDTGVGIPLSEIPKIFDRFYQIRHPALAVPHSAGLGLTIVKYLLSACGGSISVVSQIDRGSRFQVLIPKAG